MYTLVRNVPARDGLLVEAPAAAASLVVAELFYKFHSFVIECGCFLATWLVFSAVLSAVVRRPTGQPAPE